MISAYKQTQLVIWVNQILFFACLMFFFELWMIPLLIIGNYVFGFMSEASLHRYFTHKTYETTEFKEKILRVFALLSAQGPTASWVTVHRTHHAYEDKKEDPHSPFHLKWWEIYLAFLPKKYKNNLVIDLMRSRSWNYFVFENKWYFYIWLAIWTLTYLISFHAFFFIVAGAATWYISTCAINICSHRYVGKKQFEESVAYNSGLMNLLTGVGHHNNHHKFPKNYSYSVNGERDYFGLLIEKFLKT